MHNVRIIAGSYGGRILDTPKTRRTHPMGERVRNALFNSINDYIPGASVLDVFAGTGALGIEALSRGASQLTLVERDRIAQKTIQNNIDLLKLEDQAHLVRAGVRNWLSTTDADGFDIILVDPPYYEIQKYRLEIAELMSLLNPGGILILSRPYRQELDIRLPKGVKFLSKRIYSEAELAYYGRRSH